MEKKKKKNPGGPDSSKAHTAKGFIKCKNFHPFVTWHPAVSWGQNQKYYKAVWKMERP